MKSSSKILVGGVILGVMLLVVGIILYIQAWTIGFYEVNGQLVAYYPYASSSVLAWLLIILSFICFIATGASAAVKTGKEKREQTPPSASVQQTPPQYAPQQQIPQYPQQPPMQQTPPQSTMYCMSCGRAIPADAAVCPYCGDRVVKR